jgi:hypothetical protein
MRFLTCPTASMLSFRSPTDPADLFFSPPAHACFPRVLSSRLPATPRCSAAFPRMPFTSPTDYSLLPLLATRLIPVRVPFYSSLYSRIVDRWRRWRRSSMSLPCILPPISSCSIGSIGPFPSRSRLCSGVSVLAPSSCSRLLGISASSRIEFCPNLLIRASRIFCKEVLDSSCITSPLALHSPPFVSALTDCSCSVESPSAGQIC